MKISALVTSLVLGISSVAGAAPGAPAAHHNAVVAARYAPPMVRPLPVRPAPVRWMQLDTASSSRFGRTVIDVNTKLRFSKLKLEALRGVSSIDKVLVTYGNGRTQTIELDKRLGGFGAQSFAVIDLNGNARQITKIVILSKSRTRASYSISAA
jgi:hypothetical protein